MNREIKFKVWNKNRKCFYSSIEDSQYRDCYLSIGLLGNLLATDVYGEDLEYDDNDFIILQYTGLKDRDGKEIYEGDLIQLNGAPYIYAIVWQDYHWSIEDINHELPYDDPYQPFNHCVYERCVVVGNIFENPELIK